MSGTALTPHTLAGRLITRINLVSILLLTSLGALMVRSNLNSVRGTMESKMDSVASFLGKASAPYVWNYDLYAIQGFAKEAIQDPDIDSITFVREGEVFWEAKSDSIHPSKSAEITKEIRWDDKTIGSIRIAYNQDRIRTSVWEIIRIDGLMILLEQLFLAVGIITIVSRATRPLNQVVKLMRRISESGDYKLRMFGDPLVAVGSREIQTVASEFDRMIEEIQRKDATMRQNLRTMEDFIAIAHHELRTPITSIKLRMDLVERLLQPDSGQNLSREELRSLVKGNKDQIDRLIATVNSILACFLGSSGGVRLRLQDIELGRLVHEVVEALGEHIAASGSSITLETDQEVIGHWDRVRLEQIVSNLLMNAVRYGQGKPIRVVVSSDGEFAQLMVVDQGIGIPKESQERIFERFERAVTPSQASGWGLGLYIVRELLVAHRGKVEVESSSGKGATFRVILPLKQTGESVA